MNAGRGAIDLDTRPAEGRLLSGGLDLLHDGTTTDVRTTAADIRHTLSGEFDSPLSFAGHLTGSHAETRIEDSVFASGFRYTIEGAAGSVNTIHYAERNVEFQQNKEVAIRGGDQGDVILMVHSDVVHAGPGQMLVDSGGGPDQIVRLSSRSGAAEGAGDRVILQGSGDTKTVALSDGEATPRTQLDGLIAVRPSLQSVDDSITSTPFRTILGQVATNPPPDVESTIDLAFDEGTSVDLVTLGLPVGIPELIGTGITVTEPPTIFTVTSTADSGPGSLRDAIVAANALGDELAVIAFRIPDSDPGAADIDSGLPGGDVGVDVFVIQPANSLPPLTSDRTVINGASQQNLTGDTNPLGPEIVINGSAVSGAVDGLQLESDSNRVHELTIQDFSGNGILVTGNANEITGSYLGIDASGTRIAHNHEGIYVDNAAGAVIGGTAPTDRNVIAGNAVNIRLIGSGTTGALIQGNYIGVDATGTVAVTNGWRTGTNNDGILIQSGAHDNQIGGNALGAGNVISGHWEQGIWVTGGPGGNTILGNKIGTNATGDDSIYNLRGVLIVDSADHTIAGNLISGNYFGIEAWGPTRRPGDSGQSDRNRCFRNPPHWPASIRGSVWTAFPERRSAEPPTASGT